MKKPHDLWDFSCQKEGRIQPALFLFTGLPVLALWRVSTAHWQAGCTDFIQSLLPQEVTVPVRDCLDF